MQRRWIIRGIFIALLAFSLAVWAWSYSFSEQLLFVGSSSTYGISLHAETIMTGWVRGVYISEGWHYTHTVRDQYFGDLYGIGTRVLGFQYCISPPPPKGWGTFIMIPLYFPTALAAIGLFLVWRKTRKPRSGGAFTVEPPAK